MGIIIFGKLPHTFSTNNSVNCFCRLVGTNNSIGVSNLVNGINGIASNLGGVDGVIVTSIDKTTTNTNTDLTLATSFVVYDRGTGFVVTFIGLNLIPSANNSCLLIGRLKPGQTVSVYTAKHPIDTRRTGGLNVICHVIPGSTLSRRAVGFTGGLTTKPVVSCGGVGHRVCTTTFTRCRRCLRGVRIPYRHRYTQARSFTRNIYTFVRGQHPRFANRWNYPLGKDRCNIVRNVFSPECPKTCP